MTLTYVALDYDNPNRNLAFACQLASRVDGDFGFKINLDSFVSVDEFALSSGELIRRLKETEKPLFADLKMWNGSRTMSNAARGLANEGVDIINVYAHALKYVGRVRKALEGTNTKLFTLGVLTHYTEQDTRILYGKSYEEAVRMFAEIGREEGADGIIVPGTCLDAVQDIRLEKLTPGVRPEWYKAQSNDQQQPVTPRYAKEHGADYIVVGSPIYESKKPEHALERILEEVA